MRQETYVFDDSHDAKELERLRAIEAVFDPATYRELISTGIAPGWRCLEVGAGAGSVARWMSERVGETGHVMVIDTNPRFLQGASGPNLQVLDADIRTTHLESSAYDVAHARYVLIHIPDYRLAFQKMLESLKPGGWIVVEEPDFSTARAAAGSDRDRKAVGRVHKAIQKMFVTRNMDHALGLRLPALCQEFGLASLTVENDAPLTQGGSAVAKMMNMSAVNLRDKYLATGEATAGDVERYCHFTEDPTSWGVYYATVRVKPRNGEYGICCQRSDA